MAFLVVEGSGACSDKSVRISEIYQRTLTYMPSGRKIVG